MANRANPLPFDVLQPTVTSGDGYAAPVDGTITSPRHSASATPACA